jgi:hypothetical protein
MIRVRKADERGHVDRGWLDARFTFSFAEYHDPRHMGFRALRVLNDDRIAAGRGFGPHAHRDMEIITYVVDGGLRHRDSTGEEHTLGPNQVQTMSAGTGIVHSEFNASDTGPVRSIQIWIEPEAEDLEPSYQQIAFGSEEKQGRLRLLAGPRGQVDAGATVIRQDVRLYALEVSSGQSLTHPIAPGRHAWVQVVRSGVVVNGRALQEGDGAALDGEDEVSIAANPTGAGEVLLFDLA